MRWGILGTGHMAQRFVQALPFSPSSTLHAVASRSSQSVERFSQKNELSCQLYESYEELLADSQVEAVYICSPHPAHKEWIVKAAQAGKHILCEKPLTLNACEATEAIAACQQAGVTLLEGFMYRSSPQTLTLFELLKSGKIGEIKSMEASFSFNVLKRSDNPRLTDPHLGGGAILDLGCYPMSMCRLIAGVALGEKFAEPKDILAYSSFMKTGVDLDSIATLVFENDLTAQISCGMELQRSNRLVIYGSSGRLELPTPWSPGRAGESSEIHLISGDLVTERFEPEIITVDYQRPLFSQQLENFVELLGLGESPYSLMSGEDSLNNMRALDLWRSKIGLSYPME